MQWQLIKKASKIYKYCVLQFFLLWKFVRIVSSLFELTSWTLISSHLITELSIKLTKYLTFSQLHVAGFQI